MQVSRQRMRPPRPKGGCGLLPRRPRLSVRTRVIAPPSIGPRPQEQPAATGVAPPQQQQSAPWPAQLVFSWLPLWPSNSVSTQDSRRVQEALDRMHSSPDGAPPDISSFLRSLGASDLKHMRMLASLCGLTYYMGTRVTPRALARRHRLELISTSLACELISFEKEASAAEVAAEGDGACLGLADAYTIYGDRGREVPAAVAAEQPAMAALANVVPFSRSLLGSSVAATNQQRAAAAAAAAATSAAAAQQQQQLPAPQQQQTKEAAVQQQLPTPAGSQQAAPLALAVAESAPSPAPAAGNAGGSSSSWNPADLVAAKLGEAAAAASAAALAPLASAASAASAAAGSLYAGSLGLVSARLFPSSTPAALAAAAAAAAASAGPQPPLPDRLAGAAIAGIAGLEVATSHPNGAEVKAASTSSAACPSEWFVADDGAAHLRYFVIQGSDSLDHWRTNLMFEPVVFEDPALGIRVHRGAYEAACALYDRFLPLVQEQVHSHALAKVAFTGHSIGGSMATLLALMYVVRGVLRPDQLAPTITFGSPAIFCARARGGCGGAGCGGCGSCGAACPSNSAAATDAAAATGPDGILEELGLGAGSVRNVLMARDIVPRAFSCDYSLVADILRSWGPHWRDHNCLNWAARKQMFVHIGRAIVLQPSPALRFAAEPGLPLLPSGGGAWELSPPTLAARMRAAAVRAAALREGRPAAREAACVDEALAALMDNPHPLETLGDPGAYLDSGTISRYHNPDNYCRALGRLLAECRDAEAAALARPARAPALAAARRAALLAAAAGEAVAVRKTAAR